MDGHGCELTKTKTITFTGGRVVSASGRINSNCRQCNGNCHKNISLKKLLGNCWQLLFKKRVASPLAAQRLNCCDIFPRRTRINTDFCSVYSVSSVDYLFHTDGHGRSRMSASGRGGYCLSSELRRNLDGSPLAAQLLN